MQPIPPKTPTVESLAEQGGISIANSIIKRVGDFPEREKFLDSWMEHELESVPTQILWQGLEDEAAPVFVVYKLIHEAFSNSPQFFRRFITSLMTAQTERFSTVFSRETLWSVVARVPKIEMEEGWASPQSIRCLLQSLNKKSFWRRSDEELDRDAQSLSCILTKDSKFSAGVEALRRLQTEKATGLTSGNLMLFVPAKLLQYAKDVPELGLRGKLPTFKELCAKVHEVVRDQLGEGRHQSIPIDILFSEPTGDYLECFLLARQNATPSEQKELRERMILVRYFLKYAFSAYDIGKLKVRAAFYLDPAATFKPLPQPANLFHDEELVTFDEFWKIVSGKPEGTKLILKARDSAADKLKKSTLMKSIKDHFNRDRKNKPPENGDLFNGG